MGHTEGSLMQGAPLVHEHQRPPVTPSLLDSSWMGDHGNHRLSTPAFTWDPSFVPLDAAPFYEVGGSGSPELSEEGDLLSASQASTQLITHSGIARTNGRDHNAVLIQDCECISCLGIWKSQEPSYQKNVDGTNSGEAYYACRVLGCLHKVQIDPPYSKDWLAWYLSLLRKHEKAHFGEEGNFRCLSDHCTFVTKRWSDLKRHSTVMHCKYAKKFPCPVPYCKFAGDNNGFLRKDKLTSHFNRVHKGVKAAPRGTLRAIKAAPAKEAVDGAGSASGDKAA